MKRKQRATINYSGAKFNRWTVIKFSDKSTIGNRFWVCKCECGTVRDVSIRNLTAGTSKSCGCLNLERIHEKGKRTTHGLVKNIIYKTWSGMKGRCLRKTDENYKNYGGRGIKICTFLKSSPKNILTLIGERPSLYYSIDRINNNGHYSCGSCCECLKNKWPANIRWATQTQQARNRRSNTRVSINGETKNVSEWSEISGVKRATIYSRIEKGISGEDLITSKSLRRIELTGQRFGKWVVLGMDMSSSPHAVRFFVRCDCGTERTVIGRSLRIGRSKSCGCKNRDDKAKPNPDYRTPNEGEVVGFEIFDDGPKVLKWVNGAIEKFPTKLDQL